MRHEILKAKAEYCRPKFEEMIAAGLTVCQMQNRINLSLPTIKKYLGVLGLVAPERPPAKKKPKFKLPERVMKEKEVDEKPEEMLKLWISGRTLKSIGNQFGISRERVRQILDQWYPDRTREVPFEKMFEVKCLCCGRKVMFARSASRKYCSRECYAMDMSAMKGRIVDREYMVRVMEALDSGVKISKLWDSREDLRVGESSEVFLVRIYRKSKYLMTKAEREKYFPRSKS